MGYATVAVRSDSPSLIATYDQYYGAGENSLVCYIFEMAIDCKSDLIKESPNVLLKCLQFKIFTFFNDNVKWNSQ